MTDIDPRLKDLIMEATAKVLKDTGLDKVPFEDLTAEHIDMLCERMIFEIKAWMVEYFKGMDSEELKEHFDVIDKAVKDVKLQFERETKGK